MQDRAVRMLGLTGLEKFDRAASHQISICQLTLSRTKPRAAAHMACGAQAANVVPPCGASPAPCGTGLCEHVRQACRLPPPDRRHSPEDACGPGGGEPQDVTDYAFATLRGPVRLSQLCSDNADHFLIHDMGAHPQHGRCVARLDAMGRRLNGIYQDISAGSARSAEKRADVRAGNPEPVRNPPSAPLRGSETHPVCLYLPASAPYSRGRCDPWWAAPSYFGRTLANTGYVPFPKT